MMMFARLILIAATAGLLIVALYGLNILPFSIALWASCYAVDVSAHADSYRMRFIAQHGYDPLRRKP